MLAPDQLLSFVLGIAGLVALVPLGVWLATGRARAAVRALRSYSRMLLALIAAPMAVGVVLVLIDHFTQ